MKEDKFTAEEMAKIIKEMAEKSIDFGLGDMFLGGVGEEPLEDIFKARRDEAKSRTKKAAAEPWKAYDISKEDWDLIQATKERFGAFDGTTGDERLDGIMKGTILPKEVEEDPTPELPGIPKKDLIDFLKDLTITKKEKAMEPKPESMSEAKMPAGSVTPTSVKSVKIKIESDSDLAKGVTEITFNTEKLLQQLWKNNPDEVLKMLGVEAILEKIGASKALEYFS